LPVAARFTASVRPEFVKTEKNQRFGAARDLLRQVGDPNERLDFTQRIKNDLSNMEATGEATNSKSSYPMLRELLSKLQRLQGTPSGIDISA
jgi:hypothetical protein